MPKPSQIKVTTQLPSPTLLQIVHLLKPKPDEVRVLLEDLVAKLTVRRTCALLAVSQLTLASWRSEHRNPSAAATRAIWLCWSLIFEPFPLTNMIGLATWGKVNGDCDPDSDSERLQAVTEESAQRRAEEQ